MKNSATDKEATEEEVADKKSWKKQQTPKRTKRPQFKMELALNASESEKYKKAWDCNMLNAGSGLGFRYY